ncbi:MAG: peptide ABC transporter substrate-binding protein [OCS116 cluster bacterium]|uniref:Oligopeptide ABC transporter substrate-binding protein OppA n=1 Tax=OCS116 cluster bacterium TaxID=2030921 RepID=A0A2A4Z8T1_9PROT|nr:peptide ABC transporter substrate-binding protein [OCS116 cluster bacterium]
MTILKTNFSKGAAIALLAGATALTSFTAFAATHPVTGEELAADQTYTYRMLDGIPTLDPQLNEGAQTSDILRDLFEGLTNQDAEGNLIPGAAESWEATEGNTVYTFKLRANGKWSNGDPVTAGDFVYAWRRAVDPATASPYSWYMDIMSIKNGAAVIAGDMKPEELGVEAVDDLTFKVTLNKALPYFADMTAHATTFPTHQATIEKHGGDWTKPGNMISNGAYVLTEWTLKERTTRERNPMYWNNDKTIIDKVVTLVISDENVAFTRYKAGELDKTEIPAGQYPTLKESLPGQALVFPRLCTYYYQFNLSENGPEAFKDVRVRKALSYSIDRNVISEKVLKGGQFAAYTYTPEATAGFTMPTIPYGTWSQKDRDAKATELMTAAGFSKSNPLKFELLYNTSEAHKKIAIAVSAMWKQKLGVEVTLVNQEWKTYLETKKTQSFDAARAAWCGDYNEASTFLDLLDTKHGQNDGKYSNPAYDKEVRAASTSADANVHYTAAEKILADDMPIAPIYHYTGNILISPQLKGFPVNNVMLKMYSRDMYKVAK